MLFKTPLLKGSFIKRYKRFFVDFELENGSVATAHCPNTGAMKGLLTPGCEVYVSKSDNPNRKLAYTLEMMREDNTLVGVNTSHPNALVEEAIAAKLIPQLDDYASMKREVKYGQNSRIDLLLSSPKHPNCYVEVKNVHYKVGDTALFPDAVTERGQKHILELLEMKQQGHRSVMFFVIQRNDVENFDFAELIDPVYADLARQAILSGLEAFAFTFDVSPNEIKLARQVPIKI